MRRALALLALCLAWVAAPAHAAVTKTLVGSGTCATAATSCTVTFSSSVASGSFLEVEGVIGGQAQSFVFSVSDSGGNAYAGCGAGGKVALNSSNNGSILVGYSASTTAALTTSSTFTISNPSNTFPFAMQAYVMTGVSGCLGPGTVATGTWTSGAPNAFASSNVATYNPVYLEGIIVVAGGATADTMGTYAGGFTSVGSLTSSSSNRPEMFVSSQTITTGTATLTATPTSAAARAWSSVIMTWVPTGALKIGCGGCSGLLGV